MELTASTFAFVKELGGFSYELSALDRVWDILTFGTFLNLLKYYDSSRDIF